MTLIIADPIEPSPSSHDPINVLQNQDNPAYCGICGCPCLQPRLPTPPPEDPDPTVGPSTFTPAWLHQYHHLQPSRGILLYPFDPQTHPTPMDASSNPHHRIVPVHLYCVRAVLDLVRVGLYGSLTHQEESMMIGYSIPRYVGFGPWVGGSGLRTERPEMTWMGLEDQRSRWTFEREGSHLRACDLYDPTILDDPLGYASFPSSASGRPTLGQKRPATAIDPLADLPSCIISTIAQHILRLGDLRPLQPQERLDDLLSLCRTSQSFRHIDLSHSTWADLTMTAVNRYRDELMKRWMANPSGSGGSGSGQVWTALNVAFAVPVERALQRAKEAKEAEGRISALDSSSDADGLGKGDALTSRDVLYWWLYGEAWRSRRRVWRCAVFASAAARDADWW